MPNRWIRLALGLAWVAGVEACGGSPADGAGSETSSSSDTTGDAASDTVATTSVSESTGSDSSSTAGTGDPTGSSTTGAGNERPAIILMIGDGMGPGQLDTASVFAHGEVGSLFMQSLPVRGQLSTGSLSGITDSAAAATTMATGRKTLNTRIGTDEDAMPLQTVIELAQEHGLATGVVTTSYLPHATPGAFTAHRETRHDPIGIADDQALLIGPDVMLGGGAAFYLPAGAQSQRTDDGLVAPLEAAGYTVITTADELGGITDASRVVGLFSSEHMDYVLDRPEQTTQPTLRDMSLSAIDILASDPEGFLLVIEGARIDMASHNNDVDRTIAETLAFDETIEAVSEWADGRDQTTVLITADHETGGLAPDGPAEAGVSPAVTWRWGLHTNARVDIFGSGPGSDVFDDALLDHSWVHAALVSRITGEELIEPPTQLTPDGRMGDLRHLAVDQTHESSYGAGHNQLDALWLDADPSGLAIGLEGIFKVDRNAVFVLIDVDFGAATGFDGLQGNLQDDAGRVDAVLSTTAVTASQIPGFGADAAVTAWGATEVHREDTLEDAGLRGLVSPLGQPDDFAWLPAGTNFGEGVRIPTGVTGESVPGEGWETLIPWTALYPTLGGGVPEGARIAVVAVLVNEDGDDISNQALPPFPDGTEPPGPDPIALPGVVEFGVDLDEDGIADGDDPPIVHVP